MSLVELMDKAEKRVTRIAMNGDAWVRLPDKMRRPRNSRAWAIGYGAKNGFHVRRIVWGRLMARAEKRDGEKIRGAILFVSNG